MDGVGGVRGGLDRHRLHQPEENGRKFVKVEIEKKKVNIDRKQETENEMMLRDRKQVKDVRENGKQKMGWLG